MNNQVVLDTVLHQYKDGLPEMTNPEISKWLSENEEAIKSTKTVMELNKVPKPWFIQAMIKGKLYKIPI